MEKGVRLSHPYHRNAYGDYAPPRRIIVFSKKNHMFDNRRLADLVNSDKTLQKDS